MRRLRSSLIALALLSALLPVPVSARPALPEIVDLAGITTFTASETSSTLVRIPRGVTFKDLKTSYEGAGRVKGFILRKTGTFEQEGYRPVMQSVTVGQCSTRGCKGHKTGFFFTVCFCGSKDLPGVWELYVIADDTPVAVTFRIEDRPGRAAAALTRPVSAEITTLRPRVEDTNGHKLFSAGDFTTLESTDWGIVGLWVAGESHYGTAFGECVYYEGDQMPGELAFTPGCPTSDGEPWVFPDTEGGRGGVVFTSSRFDEPKGLGGWYATASEVERYGAVGLWIDF